MKDTKFLLGLLVIATLMTSLVFGFSAVIMMDLEIYPNTAKFMLAKSVISTCVWGISTVTYFQWSD